MKFLNILFLLMLIVLLPSNVASQNDFWIPLQGTPGGEFYQVERTEPNGWLFAVTSGFITYRSKDDGQTWERVFDPLTNAEGIGIVVVSPNGILYGHPDYPPSVDKYDIYRSADGGDSWTLVDSQSYYFNRIEALDGTVYAMAHAPNSFDYGIYKSADGGQNWELLKEIPNESFIRIDQFGHLIAHTYGHFYKFVSLDNGVTWDSIPGAGQTRSMLNFPSGRYLRQATFKDTSGLSIHEMVIGNLGDTTETIVTPDPNFNPFQRRYSWPLLLNDGRVLLGINGKLYVSGDQGDTWSLWSGDAGLDQFVLLEQLPNGKLIGQREHALYASTDNGLNWQPSYTGTNHNFNFHLTISQNPRTIWSVNLNGLFKTTDEGQNWTQITDNINLGYLPQTKSFALDSMGNLYVAQDSQMFFSNDGGAQLTDITPSGEKLGAHTIPFLDKVSDVLFVNMTSGIMRSDDMGNNWTVVSSDLYMEAMGVHPSGRQYAILSDTSFVENLYSSDDGGLTWNSLGLTFDQGFREVVIDEEGTIYLTVANGSLLYRSTDNGNNWDALDYPGSVIAHVTFNSRQDIFMIVGVSGSGLTQFRLLRSNNKGDNWTALPWLDDPYEQSAVLGQGMAFDENDHLYASIFTIFPTFRMVKSTNPILDAAYLFGNASKSIDDDCNTFDPAFPLKNIIIEAQENDDVYFTKTDTLAGDYEMVLDTGTYQVAARLPLPWLWDTCAVTIDLPVFIDTTFADFSVPSKEDCPYITVDLVIPQLERCFEKEIFIHYCNHGTIEADSAKLFLQLDSLLTLVDTVNNWQPVPDSMYLYCLELGALEVMECGTVSPSILVDCDSTVLGQYHCITAYTEPDSICAPPVNWSGADMEASAFCSDTSVILRLENIGDAMSEPLEYIVVEDDVVLLEVTEEFSPGETLTLTYPATGTYFRIESEQEPGHPFPENVAAFVVSCNGFNTSSLNFVNQFPLGDAPASVDRECRRNIGSFDPNDKQGFPLGFGDDHLIKPMTDIEYLIRFQNTGTAPAHNVVIRDTLSDLLNIGSLRIGAASHPFDWGLAGNGELIFTFRDIELPDSNSNEPASHGFVSFHISHKEGLPLGADIFNSAAIYFDFNEPVITNVTHHQLGDDFLGVVNTKQVFQGEDAIRISPNPTRHATLIEHNGAAHIKLFDLHGQLVFSEKIGHSPSPYLLKKNNLAEGMYFVSLLNEKGELIGTGKVVFQ